MKTYKYSALNAKGEVTGGEIESETEAQAIQDLRHKGLYPTKIDVVCNPTRRTTVAQDFAVAHERTAHAEIWSPITKGKPSYLTRSFGVFGVVVFLIVMAIVYIGNQDALKATAKPEFETKTIIVDGSPYILITTTRGNIAICPKTTILEKP